MPQQIIQILDSELPNSRAELRNFIVNKFLKELPGTGRGENISKYRYEVKHFDDGKILYLERPAYLNKGIDFLIRVEGYNFRESGRGIKQNAPRQQEIISDLQLKKAHNENAYENLKREIDNIYNIRTYNFDTHEFDGVGIPTALLLEVVKWLFIEQDVTDWNFSGRAMLKDGIDEI